MTAMGDANAQSTLWARRIARMASAPLTVSVMAIRSGIHGCRSGSSVSASTSTRPPPSSRSNSWAVSSAQSTRAAHCRRSRRGEIDSLSALAIVRPRGSSLATGSLMASRVVVIIPARYESTRLPGKPLADLHGQPMIQRVYDRARASRGVDRVLVATDDARIRAAVEAFGGEAVLTSPAHRSGTDRVAEVAATLDTDV